MRQDKRIHVLRVPFGLGAGRPGTERGPEAIWKSGLDQMMEEIGLDWTMTELTVPASRAETERESPLRHLAEVEACASALAAETAAIAGRGDFPLIVGGDHSISIGTLAGLARSGRKLGLIWFDAHGDLNTESTSPSGNIHGMALAVHLGQGAARLTGIAGFQPKVTAERTVIVGARSLDAGEKAYIRSAGIACYTMHDIDRLGMARVMDEAIRIAGNGTDGVHVSFDIDCVDPLEAPGTGTPVRGGLTYREAHLALELLRASGLVASAEFVEVNPALDSSRRTARLAAELIASLLGKTIL
ncbi:arginase [Paenibacillus ginsengihumi]|uniref:arginase n=1 Tax=Paenibacillus ginsengihumi TaxID=431596 RepID=UPI00035EAB4C|nr:arginase [Paenibacillus ginsengihumi]